MQERRRELRPLVQALTGVDPELLDDKTLEDRMKTKGFQFKPNDVVRDWSNPSKPKDYTVFGYGTSKDMRPTYLLKRVGSDIVQEMVRDHAERKFSKLNS